MSQLIYGTHAVEAALKNKESAIQEIYLVQTKQMGKLQFILDLAERRQITIKSMSRHQFDQLLGDVNHQGIAARTAYSEKKLEEADLMQWIEDAKDPLLLLVLDSVQDPHNLGACLRTADAAGVMAVVVPKDKAATLTPTVRKVACGAAESLPFVQVTNLARFLTNIKKLRVWCYGLADDAEKSIYEMSLKGHVALVMGGEGDGLRQLTRECCDELLSIPMAGAVSSVNVSVATGISLFEAVRQRNKK
ncbi:MAG: 23S rRNA (guanosine(2251)-2'-O)-methyltransferase RlmB [Gammaproteobacteria bacterium]|nr:23S rRNA (guanosine(2251)-2'-O)-methyltransferase RlmB [Gammaproteobacteria bacterium]